MEYRIFGIVVNDTYGRATVCPATDKAIQVNLLTTTKFNITSLLRKYITSRNFTLSLSVRTLLTIHTVDSAFLV